MTDIRVDLLMVFSFWACATLVVYAYVIYPLAVAAAAWAFGRPVHRAKFSGSVSIVVSAYNEAAIIARRLGELLDHVSSPGLQGEVILVSDGSRDGTAEIARGCDGSKGTLRVIE